MRYRLRTLLLLLAIGPPLLWFGHGAWNRYTEWRDRELAPVQVARVKVIRFKRANVYYLFSSPAPVPNRPGPLGRWDYQYPPASHQRFLDQTLDAP